MDSWEYNRQYVGIDHFIGDHYRNNYFAPHVVRLISDKTSDYLRGVHPEGKRIVVTDDVIRHAMDRVFDNDRGNARDMIDNVIAVLVNGVKDEMEMAEQNNKLNRWIVKYDGFGGLRQHDYIYAKKRDMNRGGFMMNY